jgi:Tryptophan halogenase
MPWSTPSGSVRGTSWDYSYKVSKFTGPGWLLIGDALRFVDPVFSSGVDVALFSAMYAYETITKAWTTGKEQEAFDEYHSRVETGVDIWYELISTFYRLQNLVTRYVTSPRTREQVIRTFQGNPYIPETQQRARELLDRMHRSYEAVLADPRNLLRPWAMDPERDGSITCPTCLGVADYHEEEGIFACRRCGSSTPAPEGFGEARRERAAARSREASGLIA